MKELYPDKLFFKKHLIILVIGSVLLFALAVPFFQIIISFYSVGITGNNTYASLSPPV